MHNDNSGNVAVCVKFREVTVSRPTSARNELIRVEKGYFYCTWLRALNEFVKEMHSPKWRVLSARFSAPAELRQHSMLKARDMAYKKIGEYKNF